ncbi:cell wall metabolism sensor histidine kinase WalK [Frankia sp. AiPa1]|uniref:sensor histidine kinase n=1 Tax=Frankia sp. AiPa1 TaxID=573492 RepID=UPI00202AEA3C|nr:HAMP domain-containing sensor histidine kinase [Frankia sp. AiPa1]MCL9761987.1 HAMP domain-containing histidine kinase [Frankia sp. AiPa1]
MRTRLIALLTVLLATVSLAIVFVTAVGLRGVLINQLDRRLMNASDRWNRQLQFTGQYPSPLPGGSSGDSDLQPGSGSLPGGASDSGSGTGTTSGTSASTSHQATVTAVSTAPATATDTAATMRSALYGQGNSTLVTGFFRGPVEPGTLVALVDDTGIYGATYDSPSNTIRWISTSQATAIAAVPQDDSAHTRGIGNDEYRVVAIAHPDGTVMVTALPMKQVNATLTKMVLIGGVVALAGVAATAVAGTIIIRVTLRPLRRVAATASRVAEMPLDRGEVALSVRVPEVDTDPRTEVGQVGAALNRMLGHIGNALAVRHASETRMRQFLADVSHELRTPLAAISGYAELTRRTHEPVPADVTYAMSRVESESARMTSLVSDLLLLARIDSGRPLEHEPVDLSRLIVHTVSDAHVAAPDHRFALDLPEEPVTVTGDAARLHQVLANLLANARSHTPPGTRVTASLAATTTDAVISVEDDGPGIAPELLPQVFERFARGDSSRSRAAGSTGLGLAIVAAVVEAHHGHVQATSIPGRTAFVVRLPRSPADLMDSPADPTAPAAPVNIPVEALAADRLPMDGTRRTQPIPPPVTAPPVLPAGQTRYS